MPDWTIGEIAQRAGVTPRTIRYYVELGLLPPPEGLGRSAGYGQEHLERLLLIKQLQANRLSLDEIREQLASPVPGAAPSPPESAAAQYLARLRESTGRLESQPRSGGRPVASSFKPVSGSYIGEQWTRIPLSEDIELHVKRRGNRIDPRISRLIKEARRIISEEQTQ